MTERKSRGKEASSFHHGGSIFHYRSHQPRDFDIPEVNDQRAQTTEGARNSSSGSSSSGRQSRFEYCNSYYSNLGQYAQPAHRNSSKSTSAFVAPPCDTDGASNFDFQSEENLFNMNFDSFYEDFVDSTELSWSSTSSASSATSFESSSVSSIYDKKYVILPEIKLDNEPVDIKKPEGETTLVVAKEEASPKQPESSGKLRCYHCNKKLGIIMIMKCHCDQYFCSAHRYMEVHNCR